RWGRQIFLNDSADAVGLLPLGRDLQVLPTSIAVRVLASGSERTVHGKRSILPGPMPYSPPAPLRAALMAVQLPDTDDQAFAASIAEMVRLGRTLGVEVVATVTQRRRALAAGTVV